MRNYYNKTAPVHVPIHRTNRTRALTARVELVASVEKAIVGCDTERIRALAAELRDVNYAEPLVKRLLEAL